jgi:uridine phosphorylase
MMSIGENHAVIEPRKGRREENLPPRAILAFTPQDMKLFLRQSPFLHKRPRQLYLSQVYTGSYQGIELALVGPMIGAPQAVLVLEKLIALGVFQVICMGWCGSLKPHVAIGDMVLPTGAFSDEGTSTHYPIEEPLPRPAHELLRPLKAVLADESAVVHEGMVWSTDAPFRETVKKIINYRDAGALAVDMETSALFTVAAFRHIQLAAALVVSDDLSGLKWVHGFREPKFLKARQKLVESLLRVLSSEMQEKQVEQG